MLSFISAKKEPEIHLLKELIFAIKKGLGRGGIRRKAPDLLGCPLPAPAGMPGRHTHFYKATARLTTGLQPGSAIRRGYGPSLPDLRTPKSVITVLSLHACSACPPTPQRSRSPRNPARQAPALPPQLRRAQTFSSAGSEEAAPVTSAGVLARPRRAPHSQLRPLGPSATLSLPAPVVLCFPAKLFIAPSTTIPIRATYKSVAPGLARLPVGDDHRLLDLAEDLEVLAQAGVRGVVGQPPDEDLGVRRVLLGRVHLRARPAARAPAAAAAAAAAGAAAAPPPPAPRLPHSGAAAGGCGRARGRGRRRGGGERPGSAEGAGRAAAEVASSPGDLTSLSPPAPPAGHGKILRIVWVRLRFCRMCKRFPLTRRGGQS